MAQYNLQTDIVSARPDTAHRGRMRLLITTTISSIIAIAIADGIANMQLEKMRVDRAKAKAAAKSRQSAKRTNGDGADSEN